MPKFVRLAKSYRVNGKDDVSAGLNPSIMNKQFTSPLNMHLSAKFSGQVYGWTEVPARNENKTNLYVLCQLPAIH